MDFDIYGNTVSPGDFQISSDPRYDELVRKIRDTQAFADLRDFVLHRLPGQLVTIHWGRNFHVSVGAPLQGDIPHIHFGDHDEALLRPYAMSVQEEFGAAWRRMNEDGISPTN